MPKCRYKKKGFSPLIAMVLLVGFSVVLATILFRWSKDYFTTQSDQIETSTARQMDCAQGVKIDWTVINRETQVFHNTSGVWFILDNIGTVDVVGVTGRLISLDSDIYNIDINKTIVAGGAARLDWDISGPTQPETGFSQMILIPKINQSDKTIGICNNFELTITDIEQE